MLKPYLKPLIVTLFIFQSSLSILKAQNIAINKTGHTANSSALLDLSDASDSTLGFLFTSVHLQTTATSAPIISPAVGLIVYNNNATMIGGSGLGFYYWSGSAWLYLQNSGSSVAGTANAYTILGNNSGSTTTPSYFTPSLASGLFANQGTTATVLHGNAAGNPSWGSVNLTSDVTGNLPVSKLNSGTGASATTYWSGNGTWSAPAGGITGEAQPSHLIGMTVVSGSATTAMYSDATPAIDPAINPTWTAKHTFNAAGTGLAVTNNETVGGTSALNGTVTLGVSGTTNGTMTFQGATFGAATLVSPNTVTTYTLTLPATGGTIVGQVLGIPTTAGQLGWVTPAGGMTGFAIPANKVGLAAVSAGSATTAMRSDAVMDIDQAITPTWTGQHIFNAAGTGLAVTNNATVGGTLGVTGASTLSGNTTVGGTLGVTGAVTHSGISTFTGAVTHSGITAMNGAASLGVIGTSNGTLNFNGATSGAATLVSPNTVTTYTLTLPATGGTIVGQVLGIPTTAGQLGWVTPAGGMTGFAIPANKVGLAAVSAGSATTAMRSDAVMDIDQAITPSWTGDHTFNGTGTGVAVTNNATVGGTLGVTGAVTHSGISTFTGAVTHSGTTAMNGVASLGVIGTSNGTLNFNGATTGAATLVSPNTVTTYTLTLPATGGTTVGQVLGIPTTAGQLGWVTPAGGMSGFAVPANKVGLAAVSAGSATTAMRSDAVIDIDQAIVPTWTGDHTFSGSGTGITVTNNATVGGSLGVSGNVGVGTGASTTIDLDINGYAHAAGNVYPTVSSQGAYIDWNALSGGTGETDFINNEGLGSGGFAFFNTSGSGAATYSTTPRSSNVVTPLMYITGAGTVGIGTSSPANSSVLDLTNTKASGGTGAPVVWPTNPSPSTNITSPVLGEEVYNTTTGCFNFYNGTSWLVVSCPCNTPPSVPTISGCTTPATGTSTYTSSITSGVTYSWTITGSGTISSGNGSSSIIVNWTSAGAGTVNLTLSNTCGSASATPLSVTVAGANPTISGATTIFATGSSPLNTFTLSSGTGNWSVSGASAGVTASISGSSTGVSSVTVAAGSTSGTFTLNCIVGSGACATTISQTITIIAAGSINLDQTAERATAAVTFTQNITTTYNNEIIVFSIIGAATGTTAPTLTINSATPTTLNNEIIGGTTSLGGMMYACYAPTAGTYTISVSGLGSFGAASSILYAASFDGFTSTASVASNVNAAENKNIAGNATGKTISQAITPGANASNYIFSVAGFNTQTSAASTLTWSNSNVYSPSSYNCLTNQFVASIAGIQESNNTAVTPACSTNQGLAVYSLIMEADIH